MPLSCRLAPALRATRALFEAQVDSSHGLRHPDYETLALIAADREQSVATVASALGVSRAHASMTVERLVGHGAVRRTPRSGDGRSLCLDLTEAGAALHDLVTTQVRNAEQATLGLTAGEYALLSELLAKVARAPRERLIETARSVGQHALEPR